MKKFYKTLFLVVLVSFTKNINAQWMQSLDFNLPAGWAVSSISIVDTDTVWASVINWNSFSSDPKVFRTTDGGETWDEYSVTGVTTKWITTIVAINGETALVTTNDMNPWQGPDGSKGIYKTNNGGQSWELVFDHNAGGYLMHFFDAQNGVCINQKDIAYTENGGDTWTLIDEANAPNLDQGEIAGGFNSTSASSLPAIGDIIWMGTDKGRICKSTDRGKTWVVFDTELGTNQLINAIAFSDSDNGFVSYSTDPFNEYKLARTTDGGQSWLPDTIPPNIDLMEIIHVPLTESTFIGASIFNNQTTFLSDYGSTWVVVNDSISISAMTFSDIDFGWSGDGNISPDNNPYIYKWDYQVSTIDVVSKLKDISVFPIPFETEMTIQSEDLLILRVSIYDVNGKIFKVQHEPGTSIVQVSMPDLPKGIYFIDIKTKEGRLVKKLVKQ